MRNLIGQAQLREVQSSSLAELLDINNQRAMHEEPSPVRVPPDGKSKATWAPRTRPRPSS